MTPPGRRALRRLGLWRSDAESEIAEELDFHFDETIRMLTASGMSRAAAV
jgi:hypothetical protein